MGKKQAPEGQVMERIETLQRAEKSKQYELDYLGKVLGPQSNE
jgi:hypothetical protein